MMYQNEFQNAMSQSRLELNRVDDTERARKLTLEGKFVVMGMMEVRCPMTDAYLWDDIVIYRVCDTEIEAQKAIDSMGDLWLFSLTPPLYQVTIEASDDNAPF